MARYKFRFLSDIYNIEIIARDKGVRIRNYLNRTYGRGQKHRWRKLKGTAVIEYSDGRSVRAEIYFYEAHGVGRVRFKIVRDLE